MGQKSSWWIGKLGDKAAEAPVKQTEQLHCASPGTSLALQRLCGRLNFEDTWLVLVRIGTSVLLPPGPQVAVLAAKTTVPSVLHDSVPEVKCCYRHAGVPWPACLPGSTVKYQLQPVHSKRLDNLCGKTPKRSENKRFSASCSTCYCTHEF